MRSAASSSRCSAARRQRGRSRALGQQQPAKLSRIGFLRAAGPNDKDFTAFRSGLRALGYVEGQNIVIEQRYAAGSYDRVGELAAELVRLNVDVIVVDGPAAAKPAEAATADIPIVFTLATDPVADGLVAGMARPGGNLTGLILSVGYELLTKRVELLKDIKPDLARLAILRNPAKIVKIAKPTVEISDRARLKCLKNSFGRVEKNSEKKRR